MSTLERLTPLIINVLCIDAGRVHPGSALTNDLGADSLDLIELAMAIEIEFNIEIPDEHVTLDTTVDDLVKLVDRISAEGTR